MKQPKHLLLFLMTLSLFIVTAAEAQTVLENGKPVQIISIIGGQWIYYQLNVPVGAKNMEVKIYGGSGDADLYVKYGARPTATSNDCRPYLVGNAETCTFPTPTSGVWHIALHGYSNAYGLNLIANFQTSSSPGASTLQYNDFYKLIATNLQLAGSIFNLVEVKKPKSTQTRIDYAKLIIVPANRAKITRVIPLKVDPVLTKSSKIGISILRTTYSAASIFIDIAKPVKVAKAAADLSELLSALSNFKNETTDLSSLLFELNDMPANGAPIYFLVETATPCTFEAGVTYASSLSSSKSSSFSLGYPGSKAPF